jgi:hypothetical protein
MQWKPTKADHIAICYYILAGCGALAPVLAAANAAPVWYSVVAFLATMASFRLRRLELGAQQEALDTPAPADAEHISVLQDALGHAQEQIDNGVLPKPKGESGSISVPVPAPPDADTVPAGRVGSQEPQG